MHFFVFVILKIHHAQRPCTQWVRCVLMNPLRKKFAKQYKMKSSSSEHDLVVLSLLKKRKRKKKYWVHPIPRLHREEGEFHLIKELRDYPECFKVYFRMSVAQFWCFATGTICLYILSLCIPHFICHTVLLLCAVDDVDELVRWHSGFWRSLVWWLWIVKTSLKMCATDAKNAENRTWSEFFYDGRKFRRQCVNVIDTMWGRIYFLTCENFGREFRTQCAKTLKLFTISVKLLNLNRQTDRFCLKSSLLLALMF